MDQEGLDDFEQELEAASKIDSAVQDLADIDQLWERCKEMLEALEKECPKVKPLRPRHRKYEDRESVRIGKMVDRWKQTIILVKERKDEGGAGLSSSYIQTVVTPSMRGSKSQQRRAEEFWKSLGSDVCSWEELQLPSSKKFWLRGQYDQDIVNKKDKGEQYQRKARMEWEGWVQRVTVAQGKLQKYGRKEPRSGTDGDIKLI